MQVFAVRSTLVLTLVCSCVGVHRRTSLYEFVFTSPAMPGSFLMVSEMGDKWMQLLFPGFV